MQQRVSMKKVFCGGLVGLMMVFLTGEAFALEVNADTCNSAKGGTIIVGKTSGTFCKSNKSMNWWSAYTWCQKLGLKQATVATACNGGEENESKETNDLIIKCTSSTSCTRSGSCPNLNAPYKNSADSGTTISSGYVWLSRAWGSSDALIVYLSSGAVNGNDRNYNFFYALCE